MALNDTLSIDIARRGTIHIPAKQADHGYDIVCTILRNGENIVDASTDTATFRVGKPDNTFYYGDATVNSDNTVSIHVDDEGQMLAVPGYAVVDVTLNDGNGAVKSTQNFVLDVQAAPGGEAIPSSSVFIELEALVAEAEESIPGATQAATAANAAAAAANAAAEAATEAAEDAQGAAQHSVRYDTAQSLTTAEQAQARENICTYDDFMQIIKVTDPATTMGDITATLADVNSVGDHVVFDVAGLNAGMYLCTIYIGAGFYRIADLVTGFEGTGFFAASDLLVDKIKGGSATTGKHYTVQWDKVNAQGIRLNDASSITTDTTNFGHFGSVNENYDNPFDSIYPWSGRKLCNIDINLYRNLTASDDITDCVVAWEDDVNFAYDHQYGVWVYTPPFFGRTYELGNYRYFDVTDENLQNNIAYPAMITGRWHGADVMLTIDGTEKHCNLPVLGLSLANVTLANQHTYAKNYGGSLVDIYAFDASALLFVVEYASLNSQNKVGRGADSVYAQNLTLASDVTNSNVVTMSATNANFVVGAVFDVGTSAGGNNVARTYIEEVNGATLTLHDAITATTAHSCSIHAMANLADEEIGSHSGYIGTNSRCNAYYRGEVLWANKWQYILGCYRQTGTGSLWIAEEGDTDNYDALNTSKHIDTGAVLPELASASWNYINGLSVVDKLSVAPFISDVGGNSTNPVGDSQYIPLKSAGNTVCLSGGDSSVGARCGLFCVYWYISASNSLWNAGSRPRLKNPS